jgi:hypothetical protein
MIEIAFEALFKTASGIAVCNWVAVAKRHSRFQRRSSQVAGNNEL